MSEMLPGGGVLPHYLTVSGGGYDLSMVEDCALRAGEVMEIVYPDSPKSQSKREIEYMVNVQYRRGGGEPVNFLARCVLATSMGGVADFMRYTMRPTDGSKPPDGRGIGNGDRVFVLFLNGNLAEGVVVAAKKHEQASPDLDSKNGHNLNLSFNGFKAEINDDGEVTVSVDGKTKLDGTPDDSRERTDGKSSLIRFTKDGSITIDNETGEQVVIDTKNHQINVTANKQTGEIKTDWDLHVGGKVNVAADGDISHVASGTARMDGSKICIGSDGANENLVLGKKLKSALSELISIFQQNASFIGIGNLGRPVIISPNFLAQLKLWEAQHITSEEILASDKFTEKQ